MINNNKKTKAVFLDRDGVLNKDNPHFVFDPKDMILLPGVVEGLRLLKKSYKLIVITNQSGISRELYTQDQMHSCHRFLQDQTDQIIDYFYFSPYHPSVTASLSRKPGSLLFEKAMARFNIEPTQSWMIGDRAQDLIPAKKLFVRTIQVGGGPPIQEADFMAQNMLEATHYILNLSSS